jgi:hypothetical protein
MRKTTAETKTGRACGTGWQRANREGSSFKVGIHAGVMISYRVPVRRRQRQRRVVSDRYRGSDECQDIPHGMRCVKERRPFAHPRKTASQAVT